MGHPAKEREQAQRRRGFFVVQKRPVLAAVQGVGEPERKCTAKGAEQAERGSEAEHPARGTGRPALGRDDGRHDETGSLHSAEGVAIRTGVLVKCLLLFLFIGHCLHLSRTA